MHSIATRAATTPGGVAGTGRRCPADSAPERGPGPLYSVAGYPPVAGLLPEKRTQTLGQRTRCEVGVTVFGGDHLVFLDTNLRSWHGDHLVRNIPMQYRSSVPRLPHIPGLARQVRATVLGDPMSFRFPIPKTSSRLSPHALLDNSLQEPEPEARIRRPREPLVTSLALAVWAEQLQLPSRPLLPGSVAEYRAALCGALLGEARAGFELWLPQEGIGQLLRRAQGICPTPQMQAQLREMLDVLHPHGVLETELAGRTPHLRLDLFRNIQWHLRDPLQEVARQGERRVPELLDLAQSTVITRNGGTVGKLALQFLGYHALQVLPDAATARAWWAEAESQTADERLSHVLWNPRAASSRVADRHVAHHGWAVCDMEWPESLGEPIAMTLLDSGTSGTAAQRRRLVRRLLQGPELLDEVFELDRELALDLLARRGRPAQAIEYADQMIEAKHSAGLLQLVSELADPTSKLRPWPLASRCEPSDCPKRLQDALRDRLLLEAASTTMSELPWDGIRTLGLLLGVPQEVFDSDQPISIQLRELDAALVRRGLDPLQAPLRSTGSD